MRKLIGQGRITKTIATANGETNRKKFLALLDNHFGTLIAQIPTRSSIQIEVASFSSKRDFPEQVLSILSFIRNVGVPLKWHLYSDGTHTQDQISALERFFNFLVVVKGLNWQEIQSLKGIAKTEVEPYDSYLIDYARKFPLGKKLFAYLNHSIQCPTLFIDSDILFYEKASVLNLILNEQPEVNGWYMPDSSWGCLDSRYKMRFAEQVYQINSGLILANGPFQRLNESLDLFKTFDFTYEYFSEQTVFHHLLKSNMYMPLPSKTFVLDSGDQFHFSYLYSFKQMAVRHYTGPVRHKMWQKDYRWHLGLEK